VTLRRFHGGRATRTDNAINQGHISDSRVLVQVAMRAGFLALISLSVCLVLLWLVLTVPRLVPSCYFATTPSSCPGGNPKSLSAKNITGARSYATSVHGYPGNSSSKPPNQSDDRRPGDPDLDGGPIEAAGAMTGPSVSIVCQFSGEMGNNLDKYAHCHAVSRLLHSAFRVKSRIVIRHQENPKWRRGANDLTSCVPFFRSRNFEEGNSPIFHQRVEELSRLVGNDLSTKLAGIFAPDAAYRFLRPEVVNDTLRIFANVTVQYGVTPAGYNSSASGPSSSANRSSDQSSISLPFLYVSWMYTADSFHDDFIEDFRRIFAYDSSPKCCSVFPDEDETVFVRLCSNKKNDVFFGWCLTVYKLRFLSRSLAPALAQLRGGNAPSGPQSRFS
jgi:hypothetical protein